MKAVTFLLIAVCVAACSPGGKKGEQTHYTVAEIKKGDAKKIALGVFRNYEKSNLFREPEIIAGGITRQVKLHHYGVPGSSFVIVYKSDSLVTKEFETTVAITDSTGAGSDTVVINRQLIISQLKLNSDLRKAGVLSAPGNMFSDDNGITVHYHFFIPLTTEEQLIEVKISWDGKTVSVHKR